MQTSEMVVSQWFQNCYVVFVRGWADKSHFQHYFLQRLKMLSYLWYLLSGGLIVSLSVCRVAVWTWWLRGRSPRCSLASARSCDRLGAAHTGESASSPVLTPIPALKLMFDSMFLVPQSVPQRGVLFPTGGRSQACTQPHGVCCCAPHCRRSSSRAQWRLTSGFLTAPFFPQRLLNLFTSADHRL